VLVRRMSRENSLWGAPRVRSELRILGFEVAERTVAKYRIKNTEPPSQTWKAFLVNHARQDVGGLTTIPKDQEFFDRNVNFHEILFQLAHIQIEDCSRRRNARWRIPSG